MLTALVKPIEQKKTFVFANFHRLRLSYNWAKSEIEKLKVKRKEMQLKIFLGS